MTASVGDAVAVDGLGMGGCRGRVSGHGAVVSTTAVAVVVVVAIRDAAASAADGHGLRLGDCAIVCTVVVVTLDKCSIIVIVIVIGHTIVTTIGVSW